MHHGQVTVWNVAVSGIVVAVTVELASVLVAQIFGPTRPPDCSSSVTTSVC